MKIKELINKTEEKDFKDRLSTPIKITLLDNEEKQSLIDKGLLNQSKENKVTISL